MKKLGLWIALLVTIGLGLIFAVPDTRYQLLAMLHLARLYEGRPLSYWLAQLQVDDASVRRHAAFQLGGANLTPQRPSKEECQQIIAALARAMADADSLVRKCAAHSFLVYDRDTPLNADAATVEGLLKALEDREVMVRQAAVRALWQGAPTKVAVVGLTAALTDKNEEVRLYACRALARLGPDARSANPALLQTLRADRASDVRKLAAKSLGLIGVEDGAPLRGEIVAELTKSLKAESAGLRDYAARALGQLRAREAIPALRQLVLDKNDRVSAGAAEALKMLEGN